MSSADSSFKREERAVAIFFCAITATGTPDNLSPEVAPRLKIAFDELLRPALAQYDGTWVTSIEDTSIAIFETASSAVEAALGLREALARRPLIERSQTLLIRMGIHFAPARIEEDPDSRQVRISGEGVRFTARLIRRVPEGGIGLSDAAYRNTSAKFSKAFVNAIVKKQNVVLNHVFSTPIKPPDTSQIKPMDTLALWLDKTTSDRMRAPAGGATSAEKDAANLTSAAPAPAPPRVAAPAAGKPLTRQWKPGSINRVRTNEPRPDLEALNAITEMMEEDAAPIDYASEAIVVIDIVQATATSDLFGWYSVGRRMVRYLRKAVRQIGTSYGLACMKSTGDGLLLTYRDTKAADVAAVNAVQASLDLLKQLYELNRLAPEERRIALRFALHFGEVDVLPDDREGPNVSFTFRVEAINHASLNKALNPIDAALLPERDYILCSERVHDIVTRRKPDWGVGTDGFFNSCGFFKLKGFTALHEVFLVAGQPRLDA